MGYTQVSRLRLYVYLRSFHGLNYVILDGLLCIQRRGGKMAQLRSEFFAHSFAIQVGGVQCGQLSLNPY